MEKQVKLKFSKRLLIESADTMTLNVGIDIEAQSATLNEARLGDLDITDSVTFLVE